MTDTFIAYIEYKRYCQRFGISPMRYGAFLQLRVDDPMRQPGNWSR